MVTGEKVARRKLKTVSPVCVSFILYSSGSSRHLQGDADFYSASSTSDAMQWSLSFCIPALSFAQSQKDKTSISKQFPDHQTVIDLN